MIIENNDEAEQIKHFAKTMALVLDAFDKLVQDCRIDEEIRNEYKELLQKE